MLSRTKLFLIGYFLPSWVATLMMWGDDRTSTNFESAPEWFYYSKFFLQIGSIFVLFMPMELRRRPSLIGLATAVALIVSTFMTKPILEGEFVMLNSSIQIAVLAVFLCFAQPSATLKTSDLTFFFIMFAGGFALQIFLFFAFGRMPSHSISDVFVRFNGITNDSLSAGMILPLFIPWAVRTAFPTVKAGVLVVLSVLTGSLFGAMFVPIGTLAYALYHRLYRLAALLVLGAVSAAFYFSSFFEAIIEVKFLSIITHLRFFLDLSGVQYYQPEKSCKEEFCESFIENGMNIGVYYMLLFYLLLICFIVPLVKGRRKKSNTPVPLDTARIYGIALLAGSFVHPIPLIPFAVPLFLILASLVIGEAAAAKQSADTTVPIVPGATAPAH